MTCADLKLHPNRVIIGHIAVVPIAGGMSEHAKMRNSLFPFPQVACDCGRMSIPTFADQTLHVLRWELPAL